MPKTGPNRHVWTRNLPYPSQMDKGELLVATVEWLHERAWSEPPDEYHLVLASGRLRMLLLDSAPLVHQVNRDHKLKITFEVGDHHPPPPPMPTPLFWSTPDALNPNHFSTGHNIPIRSLSLDQFLSLRVMVFDGLDVNVKELVKHTANVAGGVHAGSSEGPTESKLDDLAAAMLIQGFPLGIRCLRGIVRVVVDSLRPLCEAVTGPRA